MSEIAITLPDGSEKQMPEGSSAYDVAKSIGSRLAKAAIAAKVNGQIYDLTRELPAKCDLAIVTQDSDEGQEVIRHSAAHVLAGAVQRLYPDSKFAIGPTIEKGFYYDIDSTVTFNEDDLAKIESEMQKIIKENHTFERTEVSRTEAIAQCAGEKDTYKAEILNELSEETVSFYQDGDFTDLCTGPHVPSTGRIKAIKLLKTTGAYWRGDEKNQMLQRIYGTAFHSQKALDEHMKMLEQAKERDHRKIGKDLDLFSVHDMVGGGLIHWHPKGAVLRDLVEEQWKTEHRRRGYQLVYTPHIASEEIYKTSGHLENFSEVMYAHMDIDGRPFRLKPMNCPGHIMIFKSNLHSYQELPIKMAEMGTVYRYERSGVLHGLLRVRGFTIDDAHIFCTPQQLEDEIIEAFNFALDFVKSFGFNEFDIYVSTKPEKAVGRDEDWVTATAALKTALEKAGVAYKMDEGGGAFYGPKIDVKIKDMLGRPWQCSTIQFDFNLPERFDVTYIDTDGVKKRPFMVHRALMGSVERFIGCLLEHYGGAFPFKLAPVQVAVLTMSDNEIAYGKEIHQKLLVSGIRSEIDLRNERISYKIRHHTLQKVPYMLVIGKKEMANQVVAVRDRVKGDLGTMTLDNFMDMKKDLSETL